MLIVEDDLSHFMMIRQILEAVDEYVDVKWVRTGEEGTVALKEAAAAKAQFSLIIADHSLDGRTTGINLWEYCLTKYPKIAFLMVSSLPLAAFFKYVGPDRICPPYIEKPVRAGECRRLIEGLLHERWEEPC